MIWEMANGPITYHISSVIRMDSGGKKGSTNHKNRIITNHILPDLVPSDNNPIAMRLKNITNKRLKFGPRESEVVLFYCDQQFHRNEFIVVSTQSYDCKDKNKYTNRIHLLAK